MRSSTPKFYLKLTAWDHFSKIKGVKFSERCNNLILHPLNNVQLVPWFDCWEETNRSYCKARTFVGVSTGTYRYGTGIVTLSRDAGLVLSHVIVLTCNLEYLFNDSLRGITKHRCYEPPPLTDAYAGSSFVSAAHNPSSKGSLIEQPWKEFLQKGEETAVGRRTNRRRSTRRFATD